MDSKSYIAPSTRHPSILVVEHEVQLRRLLLLVLKQAGYMVEEARNGLDGMEKWTARHFDLLVSDIQMPGINGIEMIYYLGLVDESPGRFLVMTGLPATAPTDWPCLFKPFRCQEFLRKVEDLLTLHGLKEAQK